MGLKRRRRPAVARVAGSGRYGILEIAIRRAVVACGGRTGLAKCAVTTNRALDVSAGTASPSSRSLALVTDMSELA